MNITVEVDNAKLQQAFAAAPAKVLSNLNGWVRQTTVMGEREAKQQIVPHVDTGQAQSSITSTFGHLKGQVRPTAKHAIFIHEGRAPGKMPPFAEGTSLNSWARRKGMNPFLVARSIARKGTKKHPFMDSAFKIIKPKAERDGQDMLAKIVRDI